MPKPIETKQDPVTGMLDSPHFDGFGVQKKLALLKLLEENPHFGGLSSAANTLQVGLSTIFRHLQRDQIFRQRWEELKKWFAYKVEDVLAHQAMDPKKTLDRIAYLRAYMPDKYARQEVTPTTVNVQIDMSNLMEEKKRVQAIEAEIIPEDRRRMGDILASPAKNDEENVNNSEIC